MNKIEVCFSSALFNLFENKGKNVVIIDILRATSSICTAFMNDVNSITPVAGQDEAQKYKNEGWFLAAERNGIVLDFADIGNSPHYFSKELIGNKDIAYSTTNGTKAIKMSEGAENVLIGSFLNLDALSEWLKNDKKDTLIFCSGWKKHFNIEDALFAGALSQKLTENNMFSTECDSTMAAIDIWNIAKNDLKSYAKKISWNKRLNMPDVFDYCFNLNLTKKIPYFDGEKIKSY